MELVNTGAKDRYLESLLRGQPPASLRALQPAQVHQTGCLAPELLRQMRPKLGGRIGDDSSGLLDLPRH